MVEVISRIFRRQDHVEMQTDILSPHDRELMRQAADRARRRLQEAGMLDIEREAQREIRARVHAA
jgi:hypothetical protein